MYQGSIGPLLFSYSPFCFYVSFLPVFQKEKVCAVCFFHWRRRERAKRPFLNNQIDFVLLCLLFPFTGFIHPFLCPSWRYSSTTTKMECNIDALCNWILSVEEWCRSNDTRNVKDLSQSPGNGNAKWTGRLYRNGRKKLIDLVDELLAGCLSTFGALFADSLYNTLTWRATLESPFFFMA